MYSNSPASSSSSSSSSSIRTTTSWQSFVFHTKKEKESEKPNGTERDRKRPTVKPWISISLSAKTGLTRDIEEHFIKSEIRLHHHSLCKVGVVIFYIYLGQINVKCAVFLTGSQPTRIAFSDRPVLSRLLLARGRRHLVGDAVTWSPRRSSRRRTMRHFGRPLKLAHNNTAAVFLVVRL